MQITRVRTFIVDGGFRPWTFVKIETSDDGLVGWGDCTDWGSPGPIAAMVERMAEMIVGRDPMQAERDLVGSGRAVDPPQRRHRLEGDVRHRLGAVGYPGQGAQRAGLATARRQAARPSCASTGRTAAASAPTAASGWACRRSRRPTTCGRWPRRCGSAATPPSRPTCSRSRTGRTPGPSSPVNVDHAGDIAPERAAQRRSDRRHLPRRARAGCRYRARRGVPLQAGRGDQAGAGDWSRTT